MVHLSPGEKRGNAYMHLPEPTGYADGRRRYSGHSSPGGHLRLQGRRLAHSLDQRELAHPWVRVLEQFRQIALCHTLARVIDPDLCARTGTTRSAPSTATNAHAATHAPAVREATERAPRATPKEMGRAAIRRHRG